MYVIIWFYVINIYIYYNVLSSQYVWEATDQRPDWKLRSSSAETLFLSSCEKREEEHPAWVQNMFKCCSWFVDQVSWQIFDRSEALSGEAVLAKFGDAKKERLVAFSCSSSSKTNSDTVDYMCVCIFLYI